jgi:aspartate-semialdehyde dehydrogenase
VAHPAVVATAILVRALGHLDPSGGTVAAVDPVSSLGGESIELLARQAGHRLQGAPVEEKIDGAVLAFSTLAGVDEYLWEEASAALPDLDVSVTRCISGCFHGHVAHVGLKFDGSPAENEVWEALEADPKLVIHDPPLSLDSIPDTDYVSLTPPRLSRTQQHLAVTLMVDGLRIGGAITALEILSSLLESYS